MSNEQVVVKRVADALSECANALMRQGGMLNQDIAKEATKARSLLVEFFMETEDAN
jgi:hypothetical protein